MSCQICNDCEPYHITTRNSYKCRNTGKHFTNQSLGEFRYSQLSKEKQRLLIRGRKEQLGPSALARMAGVDYKTAYRFLNKRN